MADSKADRFSDLVLNGLPFSLDHVFRSRMNAAADRLNDVQPATDQAPWEAYTREEPSELLSGGSHVLFQGIYALDTAHDWLDVCLDVAYETPQVLRVSAAAQVQCWCDTDHGMDTVEEHTWLAGDAESLARAWEAGCTAVSAWFSAELITVAAWLRRAGMPPRPPLKHVRTDRNESDG